MAERRRGHEHDPFPESANPFQATRYDGDDDGGRNGRGRVDDRGEEKLVRGELRRFLGQVSDPHGVGVPGLEWPEMGCRRPRPGSAVEHDGTRASAEVQLGRGHVDYQCGDCWGFFTSKKPWDTVK